MIGWKFSISFLKDGLPVYIFRDEYTSEINVLKDKKRCTIIDDNVCKLFEASERMPAVRIVRRVLFGKEYIHAEPYKKGHYSFGGAFIHSSDSRFSEINKYPIPLHDRDMNLEK